MGETLKLKALAKINLGLDVLGRRENGYHDIDSIMTLVNLYDVLDKNMQEYEWSVLTVEVPAAQAGTYLAKINISFMGEEIAIRAMSIEA